MAGEYEIINIVIYRIVEKCKNNPIICDVGVSKRYKITQNRVVTHGNMDIISFDTIAVIIMIKLNTNNNAVISTHHFQWILKIS